MFNNDLFCTLSEIRLFLLLKKGDKSVVKAYWVQQWHLFVLSIILPFIRVIQPYDNLHENY